MTLLVDRSEVLRLEIEDADAALPNLAENPSGEKGAWSYLTPVGNTYLYAKEDAGGDYLEFLNFTSGVASYWTTDFMEVAATEWVAARFDTVSGGTAAPYNVKIRLEWYNAAKSLLSSSTQSAGIGPTAGTTYYAAVQAPANTAYVKLRFDFYNNASNPGFNTVYRFRKVMVTKNSVNIFSTVKTNLVPNPSAETNNTLWTATLEPLGSGATFTRSTAQAAVGSASFAFTGGNGAGSGGFLTSSMYAETAILSGIVAGKRYTVQARHRSGATARKFQLTISFFDASNNSLGSFGTGLVNTTVGSWTTTRIGVGGFQVVAPAGATKFRVQILFSCFQTASSTFANGEVHYVDAVSVVQEDVDSNTYFDGATTPGSGKTYAWTGTAHLSTSTESNTNFEFVAETPYIDILQSAYVIAINRGELNVGTMQAALNDPALDPAANDILRPGRKCRVMCYNTETDIWEPLFTGHVKTANAEYDADETNIDLIAVDNGDTIANIKSPNGVENIYALSSLFQGKGVPWNFNGSGNEDATYVDFINDNASLMDQVVIARDTDGGYAWIDRFDVVNACGNLPFYLEENTMPNPFFIDTTQGNTTGYTAIANCTLSYNSGQYPFGLFVDPTANGTVTFETPFAAVTPGLRHELRFTSANPYGGPARSGTAEVRWYDSSQVFISAETPKNFTVQIDVFGDDTIQFFTPPANAAYAKIRISVLSTVSTEIYAFDRFGVFAPHRKYTDNEMRLPNIDFNMDRCINEVNIKLQTYNESSRELEEELFGPYRDEVSIKQWGRHEQTFLVADSDNFIDPAEYAAAVLATNSVPKKQINSFILPITDTDQLTKDHVFADIYQRTQLVSASKGIDDLARITNISHMIGLDKWEMGFQFDVSGGVALPQETPSGNGNKLTRVTSFTPGWQNQAGTGLAIGNGTLQGTRIDLGGGLIRYEIYFERGSTTNFGNVGDFYYFVIPDTMVSHLRVHGSGWYRDASTNQEKALTIRGINQTTIGMVDHTGSRVGRDTLSWAVDDVISLAFETRIN